MASSSGARKETRRDRDGDDSEEDEDLPSDEDGSIEAEVDEAEVQAAERARRKREGLDKEPLSGLSSELQEALMVEDLLFVLMVSD